ncbi:amidohydrolase family protein, partial [bacterium]|nr:amidohydrolase family protein [bacterium]
AGGIKPHYYCLPVAKRENHRIALLNAATSGNSSFFLGTDSAPHFDTQKESACGCAGCFTALNTIPILAHLFEQEGSLKKLENFTSINGANFYNLPLNSERLKLIKEKDPIEFPNKVFTPEGEITVFDPGFPVSWSVKSI